MEKLKNVLNDLNINSSSYDFYGKDSVKINPKNVKETGKKSKLILMTSINPTAAGEGKTTTAIGLQDGLRFIKKNSLLVLREPSMGPVFGRKGTATGGGRSEVNPMDKINFHFTGDFHAITSANNLIASVIDNAIYWSNKLNIDPNKVVWKRCIDLNDRSLRDIEISVSKSVKRKESFTITAASNMMTIITISESIENIRERISNALVAYTFDNKPIYVKDLRVIGSVMAILKEAVRPNLVLTKEGSPTLVHCGPFANIAIGTNSIISTNLARSISDYTIFETGFGSDLGFEKFMNIVNYKYNYLVPDCVVMVVTLRALNLHNDIENNFTHLEQHINHVTKYNLNFIVAINSITGDKEEEVNKLIKWLKSKKYNWEFNKAYSEGAEGAKDLATKVVEICDKKNKFKPLLSKSDSIMQKLEKVIKNFYYLDSFELSEMAKEKLKQYSTDDSLKSLPICMVKSSNSIDGNDNKDQNYKLIINDFDINTGAGFILAYTNNVLSMPGLNKEPNFVDIDLVDENIINLK